MLRDFCFWNVALDDSHSTNPRVERDGTCINLSMGVKFGSQVGHVRQNATCHTKRFEKERALISS
jgi:hypothetical protein